MKTNNLTKRSFLMSAILMLSAGFNAMVKGGHGAPMAGGGERHLHSHGSFHKRGTFKGWMRENKKSSFNKNR